MAPELRRGMAQIFEDDDEVFGGQAQHVDAADANANLNLASDASDVNSDASTLVLPGLATAADSPSTPDNTGNPTSTPQAPKKRRRTAERLEETSGTSPCASSCPFPPLEGNARVTASSAGSTTTTAVCVLDDIAIPLVPRVLSPIVLENDALLCQCPLHEGMTFFEFYGTFEEIDEHFKAEWRKMRSRNRRRRIGTVPCRDFVHSEFTKLGWRPYPRQTLPRLNYLYIPPDGDLESLDPPGDINYEAYTVDYSAGYGSNSQEENETP